MKQKETLIIRIDKSTKGKLLKVAKASNRNMSDYIRLLINKAAEESIKL
jgi:antitoxin component of RelBE/YafQ-DinJ toxin-antitoxin module